MLRHPLVHAAMRSPNRFQQIHQRILHMTSIALILSSGCDGWLRKQGRKSNPCYPCATQIALRLRRVVLTWTVRLRNRPAGQSAGHQDAQTINLIPPLPCCVATAIAKCRQACTVSAKLADKLEAHLAFVFPRFRRAERAGCFIMCATLLPEHNGH